MRWRLYLFFLAITAAFCFMLLTAVTDYGTGGTYQPAMVSARSAGDGQSFLSAARPIPQEPQTGDSTSHALAIHKFDPQVKPGQLQFFVPHNNDIVQERHDHAARSKRSQIPAHKRLRLDDTGWYREETALVTAYCPCPKCCGTQSPGITSTGKNAWTPGLAADPMYLDYGTPVYVPGYGNSVVDDTGGAMRRHWRRDGFLHIDVRMTYHYEARQWGKKYLKVKIYQKD